MLAQELQSGDKLIGYGHEPEADGSGKVIQRIVFKGKSARILFADGTSDILPSYSFVYVEQS